MVRIHPDPPSPTRVRERQQNWNGGAIAQLGERLLCKQEVIGSIPIGSTSKPQARGARYEAREETAISSQAWIDWCFFGDEATRSAAL
jgi:hypothetical protein